ERQQVRDQVIRGKIRGSHQGAVRERDAQHGRLRATDELGVLAAGLVAGLAVGTSVVGSEERSDDELAGLDRGDRAADLFDDAAILMAHRGRLGHRVGAPVGPQVGPAYAGGRHPDDRIRRLDDPRVVALLETHIARGVENRSSHGYLLLSTTLAPCAERNRAVTSLSPLLALMTTTFRWTLSLIARSLVLLVGDLLHPV